MKETGLKRWPYIVFVLSVLILACNHEKKRANDLFTNLEGAEFAWDSGLIDFGVAGFREYLISGWQPDRQEQDGTTSALFDETGVISFFSFNHQDRNLVIRCKTEPGSSELQSLTLMVNGVPLTSSAQLTPHYKEFSFFIPGEMLERGLNYLKVTSQPHFSEDTTVQKIGVSFDYIRFETLSAGRKEVPEGEKIRKYTDRSGGQLISAPMNSSLSVYVMFQKNPNLEISFELPPDTEKSAAARFIVRIETDDGLLQETYHVLEKKSWGNSVHAIHYKRDSNFKQVARISMTTTTVQGKVAPKRVYWRNALLSGKQSEPAPPAAIKKVRSSLAKKTNVIIYLIDALRPDYLEPYGYAKPVSPRIQEFSKDSVLFENAYAVVSWTRASVGTILSGLYPSSHLVEDRRDSLPQYIPILPEQLKLHGYQTYSIVTNGNLSSAMNFARGYDSYTHLRENARTREVHVQSDALFHHLQEFATNPGFREPAFLYIHAIDPHDPFTPGPSFETYRPECDYSDVKIYRPSIRHHGSDVYRDDLTVSCVRSLYEAEVRKSDHYFGLFIDLLKKHGLYENSLILLTADHGESLYEHKIWGHGQSAFESELKVPLLIRFPRGQFAGKRSSLLVAHTDLFPTILTYLGIAQPRGIQGQSILSDLENHLDSDRPVFSELTLDNREWKSVRYGRYKLIETWQRNVKYYALFDIPSDPGESFNLRTQQPVLFGFMKQLLNEWTASQQKRKSLLQKPKQGIFDKETEDALKALGYLQ